MTLERPDICGQILLAVFDTGGPLIELAQIAQDQVIGFFISHGRGLHGETIQAVV
jgi:hypothetical protein